MPENDQWRGRIEARVEMLEKRLESMDQRAGVLGEGINGMRSDMRLVQSKQQDLITKQESMVVRVDRLVGAIEEDAKVRIKEREEARMDTIEDLEQTLRQKGLNKFQWLITGATILGASVLGPVIILAITGKL